MSDMQVDICRYCNVTFVKEGSIPPDSINNEPIKLLRCSRCQLTFYRSKDEQRAHWKVHKKVCTPPSNDLASRINNMSMDEAAAELMGLMKNQNFREGSVWVLLLQRIYHLFGTSNDRSECFNEEIISNQIVGNGMILSAARQLVFASNFDIEILWAIPNFANFILSVDLTSDYMLKKKHNGEILSEEELSPYEFDPEKHTDSGFANLIVLVLTVIRFGGSSLPCVRYITYLIPR